MGQCNTVRDSIRNSVRNCADPSFVPYFVEPLVVASLRYKESAASCMATHHCRAFCKGMTLFPYRDVLFRYGHMTPAGPGSSPSGNRLIFWMLGGLSRERISFLANASMALTVSAHTLRMHLVSIVLNSILVNVGTLN